MRFRNRHLLAIDVVLLLLTPVVAYAIRLEGFAWPAADVTIATAYVASSVPLKVGLLLALGCYRRLWRQASIADSQTALSPSVR